MSTRTWTAITIEHSGATRAGRYRLHDKGLTVDFEDRQRFALLCASPADTLARIIIRELVEIAHSGQRE